VLSGPFAAVLRARRAELNARFAETRHRLPALDAGAFGDFLRQSADPLVRAVDAACPGRAEAVALAAFDVALELVGRQAAGPATAGGGVGGAVDELWRRALPAGARAVAAAPERLIAALSNAAHQVAATPGACPGRWVAELERLAPACSDPDDLLRLGQVAAWRAGLAHYRRGAIASAAALPEPVALAAVGAAPTARWSEVEAGLLASEWFDPSRPAARADAPARVAAAVGAFRGFGGPFVAPPHVSLVAGQLHVASADERWLLTADLFGATFHRLAGDEWRPTPPGAPLPPGLRIEGEGALALPSGRVTLPGRGAMTSAAATATTLAVTWSLTHQVTLVALA
jgi:hypothetical protein